MIMPKKLHLLLLGILLTWGSWNIGLAHSIQSVTDFEYTSKEIKLSVYNFETDIQSNNLLFENETLKISKIYPNPASEFVAFRYQLKASETNAKIILRNVLGKEVGIFKLDSHTEKLSISVQDYVAGMYFYTLSIDGKNLVTRKLLIKH